MVAGSRSLREVEQLTAELTPALRTKLGIPRRVPDTTLRDALSSLEPDGLPFGVVSLDGKATSVPAADDFFAQRQTATAEARLLGLVRTVTATLTSSTARSRLTDAEWLLVVRRHWGVETAHQLQGGAFAEDNHPWIEQNPRATVVVMVLGRIAYTLLALWRGVTLRSKQQRTRPWRELMHDIWLGAVQATAQIPCGSSSRDRRLPPAPA